MFLEGLLWTIVGASMISSEAHMSLGFPKIPKVVDIAPS